MSFGLTNAHAVFIDLMNRVCKPYFDKFVFIFIDDILIYSKNEKEPKEHLKAILELLKKEKSQDRFYQRLGISQNTDKDPLIFRPCWLLSEIYRGILKNCQINDEAYSERNQVQLGRKGRKLFSVNKVEFVQRADSGFTKRERGLCGLISTKKEEDRSEGKPLEDVPVIQDFPEVFPKDLLGLPPA
nr:putative reverse transcriptase domain-containing protein [Tanacetum cinerariifolium]